MLFLKQEVISLIYDRKGGKKKPMSRTQLPYKYMLLVYTMLANMCTILWGLLM